jgi:hypothetical protein
VITAVLRVDALETGVSGYGGCVGLPRLWRGTGGTSMENERREAMSQAIISSIFPFKNCTTASGP